MGVICKHKDKTKILLQIGCRFVLSFNFLFLFLPFFVEFFSLTGGNNPVFFHSNHQSFCDSIITKMKREKMS